MPSVYIIRKVELIYEHDPCCRFSFPCKTPVRDLGHFRRSLIYTHQCDRVLLVYEEHEA